MVEIPSPVLKDCKAAEAQANEIQTPSTDTSRVDSFSEKLASTTTMSTMHNTNAEHGDHTSHADNVWRPSLFKIRPLLGLAALGLTIVCLFVSLAVLLGSHGQSNASWYFQPTVYLAITTALSNTALNCALVQAAPISWWYKASRGSTIRDLELEWEAGQSFPRALLNSIRYGRYVNLLTIASFAVALVVVDGPLLQRATTVRPATVRNDITLDIAISPELPTGFSGNFFPGPDGGISISPAVLQLGVHYSAFDPIPSTAHCNGTCRTKVRGPGLAKTGCVSQTWPITPDMLIDPSSTWGSGNIMAAKPVLFTSFSPYDHVSSAGNEEAVLTTGIANYNDCNGQYVETNCTLVSAILEYDVEIHGDDISFSSVPGSLPVVALANNTHLDFPSSKMQPSTITGIVGWLEGYIFTNTSLSVNVPNGTLTSIVDSTLNPVAMKYMHNPYGCHMHFDDPTEEVIGKVNEFFFRAGIWTAPWTNTTNLLDPGLSVKQTVPAKQTQQLTVFHTDLRWFAGAAVLQLLTIIFVLPVFWGWWKIGTDLTLSPFQTGKMLQSPLLSDVNSAAGATGVVRDMGDLRVRFGLVEAENPAKTEGYEMNGTHVIRSRIGIAPSCVVASPQKGMTISH